MLHITGYRLTVRRGARAGLVRVYDANYSGGDTGKARRCARNFADRLDREYGAICASVQPIFADMGAKP